MTMAYFRRWLSNTEDEEIYKLLAAFQEMVKNVIGDYELVKENAEC